MFNHLRSGLYLLRAQNHLLEDSYSEAVNALQKADRLRPGDYNIKRKLGDVWFELMRQEGRAEDAWSMTLRAKEQYIASSRLNPLDALSAYGMARVEARLEQLYPFIHSLAENNPYQPMYWFKEAIRLRPNSTLFHYTMAYYLSRTNRTGELLPFVRTLVRVYPSTYFNLKREPFWSADVREAVKHGLEQAVEQDISLKHAYKALSSIAAEDEEWGSAITHLNQALKFRTFENSNYDFFRLGLLYLKNREHDSAEMSFIRGLSKSEFLEDDLERIYSYYRREKDIGRFPSFFEAVTANFIVTPPMEILHARALYELEEYDNAREILLEVNRRRPEAAAYYWLSRIAEAREEWDIMDLAIQKATVLDPENSEYHYRFSSVLKRLKKFERAEKEASLAIKHRASKPSPWYFNNRAWIRWSRKDFEGAAKDWRSAISLKPGHAPFYARAGEAYAKIAYWPMAEEHYEKAIELDPQNKKYKERLNFVKQN